LAFSGRQPPLSFDTSFIGTTAQYLSRAAHFARGHGLKIILNPNPNPNLNPDPGCTKKIRNQD
jgi:hypothetical protein